MGGPKPRRYLLFYFISIFAMHSSLKKKLLRLESSFHRCSKSRYLLVHFFKENPPPFHLQRDNTRDNRYEGESFYWALLCQIQPTKLTSSSRVISVVTSLWDRVERLSRASIGTWTPKNSSYQLHHNDASIKLPFDHRERVAGHSCNGSQSCWLVSRFFLKRSNNRWFSPSPAYRSSCKP